MTALRGEFPIFAAQPAPFHYLDNAATGQICRAAAQALWRFETECRANVKRGVYRLADQATVAFQTARREPAGQLELAAVEAVAAVELDQRPPNDGVPEQEVVFRRLAQAEVRA